MLARILAVLIVFCSSFLFAQTSEELNEIVKSGSQTWYFGFGAGLQFSSGEVQPLHDGKMYTNEGCASVSDKFGNLLFYTDGVTVWDKSGTVICTGLNGNHSSTQSSVIIPKTGDSTLFFIFTVDTSAGSKGACYSILNFYKRKLILQNKKLLYPVSEKLTATLHANGKDAWIILHKWNSTDFYAYPLTAKGLSTPVISSIGLPYKETGGGRNREAIGEMKLSLGGKKIAVAICYRGTNNFEILDFDNSTGIISNPSTFSLKGFPYGLCFSPDNSKLYISFLKGKTGVIQYDLKKNIFMDIIENGKENSFGSMQIGANGKIYVARPGNFLDVINEPNEEGTRCDYQKDAINLSPATSTYGLPNFWNFSSSLGDCKEILEDKPISKNIPFYAGISTCENQLVLDAKNPGSTYAWSTGGKNRTQTVDSSQLIKVIINKDGCKIKDSVRVILRKDLAVFRYLPVFNPDNGFINTDFFYSIEDVEGFNLKVFDRKKKHILFETDNVNRKWSGKDKNKKSLPEGIYPWIVIYTPRCPKGSKQVIKEGTVEISKSKLK